MQIKLIEFKVEIKKSILLLPFVFIVIFAVIFSSVFLPRIKVEITIQPQYQSIAKAEKKDNIATDKPHCVVLSANRIEKVTDKINELYAKVYRLNNFSAIPSYMSLTSINAPVMMYDYFAAVCKE
ncbi:MAG: hypothetical protein WBA39_34560 [Rivularia sp. (in: cyanobacteria)]